VSEERQYDRVISTQLELHALVSEALVTGELNLSKCKIDIDFNLSDLLRAFDQAKVPCDKPIIKFSEECPFSINANYATFTGNTYFINITFKEKADFYRAIFTVGANFMDATFQGKTSFKAVTFTNMAYFANAIFTSETTFRNARFTGIANFVFTTFIVGANFIDSTFQGKTFFVDATFTGNTYFKVTKFSEQANFMSASFSKDVAFDSSTFSKEADFKFATFSKEADFKSTTFTEQADFRNVKITEGSSLDFYSITLHDYFEIVPASLQGNVNITSPKFEGQKSQLDVNLLNCNNQNSQGSVTFDDLKMNQDRIYITVRNLKEEVENVEIKFETCNFYGKNISFKKVKIDAVNFDDVDDISGFDFDLLKPKDLPQTILPFNFEFKAIHKNTDGIIQKAKKAEMWASIYANLKAKADEQGERQLGNDYFFWQLYFQKPNAKNWENGFYFHTSAYGLSVGLPLLTFGICFLLFSLGYMWNLHSFTESNLVSLSASVPFVFNDVEVIKQKVELIATQENWWFYPLYILQHLIQGYLLFQIGAAIRNKVKR
jgi:hypothetical protein